MEHYFFHLHERDDVVIDEEGASFVNLKAATVQATKTAREIIGAYAKEGRICLGNRIEIEHAGTGGRMVIFFRDVVSVSGL
jgi:hypothetical protein